MVSTKRFIWAIPPATSAGRIKIKNFFTPGLLKLISGKGIFFMAARGASWKISCKIPAKNTPQANAITGISIFGAISQADPIKHKLNINGVIAGIENLSWEFWIPAAKATREINARYGNIILKRLTAKSCFFIIYLFSLMMANWLDLDNFLPFLLPYNMTLCLKL